MITCIKSHNDSDIVRVSKEENKSASMSELKTPEKLLLNIKAETPTRYRSLDTLTAAKEMEHPLPAPRPLQRARAVTESDDDKDKKNVVISRQSTYTLSSGPDSFRRRNKTSSPIRFSNSNMLEKLIAAEKVAENLRNNLSILIQEYTEESKNDSSMSSLALDVSKISVLKVPETPICQFASSPNLSGISAPDGFNKTRMKRYESVSTSNLVKSAPKERKLSGLRRISPNIFKKKDAPSIKVDRVKSQDIRSKLHGLFKPKVVTPSPSARSPKVGGPLPSPNPSISSRKKYSHIKSTIPRPAKKE